VSILVTGGAGFIGMHVIQSLLSRGEVVVGVDSLNDYYDVSLKEARLAQLNGRDGFTFERFDVVNMPALADCFARHKVRRVVHLAAHGRGVG